MRWAETATGTSTCRCSKQPTVSKPAGLCSGHGCVLGLCGPCALVHTCKEDWFYQHTMCVLLRHRRRPR